jgi:hypothetical protein
MQKAALNSATLAFLAFCSFATILFVASNAHAQQTAGTAPPHGYYTVKPLTGMTHAQVRAAVAASTTIPMWDYSIVSPLDGLTYTGSMVGRSPFYSGMRTTSIQVYLIPVKVTLPLNTNASIHITFDPMVADSTCLAGNVPLTEVQQSPLFNNASFTMNGSFVGTTQYVDAFQRAAFFNSPAHVSATGDRYHTLLNVTTLSEITITIPSGKGLAYDATAFTGGCGHIGVVDNATLDSILVNTEIPALAGSGVGPTSFPLFLLYNVVQGLPGDNLLANCCVLGYHGAVGSLATIQTYSPSDFDSTRLFNAGTNANGTTLSHEIAEWLDDPVGGNPTPGWGGGQVPPGQCQSNLEVGDPLSGTNFPAVLMPNGITYDLQELAFFSWFFRQSPSLGTGGKFSNHGTFTTAAAKCP